MLCRNCGCQYRPGTEVCLNCGTELIKEPEIIYTRKPKRWLIVAGWIFSVLGGLIGIFISLHIMNAKIKTDQGNLVYKYDDESRQKGRTMFIVCLSMMVVGIILQIISFSS